jgi:DNA-binding transcriptional MerR regulator
MTMLRAQEKLPEAFRTISEVATELDVPQHVLRFWESKFPPVKPLKRGGGRRYYRPDDLDLLRGIRALLYRDGLTIRGVQKILREQGVRYVMELGRAALRLSSVAHDVRSEKRAEPISPAQAFLQTAAGIAIEPDEETDADIEAEAAPEDEPTFGLTERERARLSERLAELLELKARLNAVRRMPKASR